MNALRVRVEEGQNQKGSFETRFILSTPDGESVVHFSVDSPGDRPSFPTRAGDAALAAFLLPALRLGLPLEINECVSQELLARAPILQEIFQRWHPEFFSNPEPIAALHTCAATPSQAAQGCFFSGGVDSFYSSLKHLDGLDALVFVHGFDLPLEQTDLRNKVSRAIHLAADSLELPLIEVETGLRSFSDRHVYWGTHYFGSAMAATGHLLAPALGHMWIPASSPYGNLDPFGSHFYSDEMWSGNGMRFVNDGGEALRIEKTRSIMQHPAAREHLRVCWKNPDNSYNCGRCEKCLRTMAALEAMDLLDDCHSFPTGLDLDWLAEFQWEDFIGVDFYREIIEEADRNGKTQLSAALTTCLNNNLVRLIARKLGPVRDDLSGSPVWRDKALPQFKDAIFSTCLAHHGPWTASEVASLLANEPAEALRLLHKQAPLWLAAHVLLDLVFPPRLRRLFGGSAQ